MFTQPSSPTCLRLFTGSAAVLGLGASALFACSSSDGGSGTGGSHSGGSQVLSGGTDARGGSAALGGGVASGGASTSGGAGPSSGGTLNSGGSAPTTGGATSGGSGVGGASGGVSAGNGGAGSGGTSGSGGNTGSAAQGGSNAGASGAGGGGAGKGGVACPANATFCSGFEDAALPTGAVYKLNGDPATPWTHDFEVDASLHNSGNSSLRVKSNSESSGAYKMLAVPAPGAAFWVRFYLRSDVDLGSPDHNVFAQASGSDDPNDAIALEFAEDVGLAFNSHDDVRWPIGFGRLTGGATMPFTLPKDTWHCIEISFDGTAKVQKLLINGVEKINATGYPAAAAAFKTFKFGYNALHGTVRKTWYDDVAVAPAAIGCL